nr:rhamnan synthesis F family protein [Neoroseomonas soli]
MVRRQLAIYRDLGFAVVLVSNSPAFPEASWQEARRIAALVVHRRNRGLDFGAWKDLVPVARARWPGMDELLLANDSVMGPVRPLEPYLAAMRAGGPGFYGMLESIQGGPHMQSWFLLAHGRKAVADLTAFLAAMRLSRSKWTIVQRGELRLARAMREAGNRVAALFGYAGLVETALREPAERVYLDRALPGLLEGDDREALRALLMDRPLNPSQHLWRVLAGPAGCPFIKTELARRNPGRLPEVETWPALVPPDSPCPVEEMKAHLAALGP